MVDAYTCECLVGGTNLYQCTGSVGRVQFYSSVVSADYERRNYARDVNQYVDVLYNLNNFNRYFWPLILLHGFCDSSDPSNVSVSHDT